MADFAAAEDNSRQEVESCFTQFGGMLDVTERQGLLIVPECSDETPVSPGDQYNRRARSAERLLVLLAAAF